MLPLAYSAVEMKKFSVLFAVIGFCVCSCERHEWESDPPKSSDTINLFKHEEGHEKDGDHKDGDKDAAKPEEGKKDAGKPEAE